MDKIKGTVYARQAGYEGYKHVAHVGLSYNFENSHQENNSFPFSGFHYPVSLFDLADDKTGMSQYVDGPVFLLPFAVLPLAIYSNKLSPF